MIIAKGVLKELDRIKCDDHDFSFRHYQDMLEVAKKIGYQFPLFRNFNAFKSGERILLLRHDVEFKIERALQLAEIEAKLGISATYFIRVHANNYNPFSYNCYVRLRRIRELGHEIGLHFESGELARITGEDELQLFLRAKGMLENVIGDTIVSVSEHADKRSQSGVGLTFFQRFTKKQCQIENQAYEPRFFRKLKYLSDSNGVWREGCLCHHIGREPKIQVLIHPYLWYAEHYFIDETVTMPIHRES